MNAWCCVGVHICMLYINQESMPKRLGLCRQAEEHYKSKLHFWPQEGVFQLHHQFDREWGSAMFSFKLLNGAWMKSEYGMKRNVVWCKLFSVCFRWFNVTFCIELNKQSHLSSARPYVAFRLWVNCNRPRTGDIYEISTAIDPGLQ